MQRGRIQIGLILALLVGAGAVSVVRSIPGPSYEKQGPGVAFAQDGEEGGEAEPPATEPGEEPMAEEPAAEPVAEPEPVKKPMPKGAEVYETHADQTPPALRQFETEGVAGIRYAGLDSPVAQTTEKIRALDIARAAQEKYRIAEDFLSPDRFDRSDPLEITDAIPKELRQMYAGEEGISALSDAQLEQLFFSQIRTQIQYYPINVIGTMDNGSTQMVLVSFGGGGSFMLSVGQTVTLFSFPIDPQNPRRTMTLTMTPTTIREDFVSMRFDVSYIQLNGNTETLEPVIRNFYIRMVY